MPEFTFRSDEIALPRGAWAKAHRMRLRHGDASVLAVTQGAFRSYLHPLSTPAGFCVTSESPSDHPHHCGAWIASDHVHAMVPAANAQVEEYTYNFYVDEVFQGRSPGRIVGIVKEAGAADDGYRIVQTLEWHGPTEWAAPAGRLVAREVRTITVDCGARRNRIDMTSRLSCGEFALKLGPTRHAWFNVRVADSMIVQNGGAVTDDRGLSGGVAVSGAGARWVDFTGPVGGGAIAGVCVVPHRLPGRVPFWFVADWGVVTVGPFRDVGLSLEPEETFESSYTLLVHDGPPDRDEIELIAQ
ncbi:hypothetical protein FQ775_09655 [Nitratireductor mangrovi]|uniref:Uncharacterized protein n=1 Tax=Nitratireductor mangrovi TaxID=2599600 RepID=A0A5B8KYC6_9HYPH|nr:DUF6807 family protein [Nitratireductor mangrovi]QDZ00625.1 hypothetical protein FQ775_09655 [Nitratireductor mangrovi]